MSLTRCLKKLRLDAHEAAILKGITKDYRDDGVEPLVAAEKAIQERLDDAIQERADILNQVKAHGGDVSGYTNEATTNKLPKSDELVVPAETKSEQRAAAPVAESQGIIATNRYGRNYGTFPTLADAAGKRWDEDYVKEKKWFIERAQIAYDAIKPIADQYGYKITYDSDVGGSQYLNFDGGKDYFDVRISDHATGANFDSFNDINIIGAERDVAGIAAKEVMKRVMRAETEDGGRAGLGMGESITEKQTIEAPVNKAVGEISAQFAGGKGQGLSLVSAKIELARHKKKYPDSDVVIEDAGWKLQNGEPAQKIVVRKRPAVGVTTGQESGAPRNKESLLSRSVVSGHKSGMSVADVKNSIATVIKRWKNAPDITVVDTVKEVPESAAPSNMEGAYLGDGKVYLVASNLHSQDRVLEVLAHEAVGHAAMEELFGSDLNPILNQIGLMEKGGNKLVREIAQRVDESQPGLDRNLRAKEIIAVMAERGIHNGVMQRVRAAIQRFLRAIGISRSFNDSDISAMLRAAERNLERGQQSTGTSNVPAYSVNAPAFYSQLARSIESAKQNSMPAKQWVLWLKANASKLGIKQDEIDAVGVNEWLDLQQGQVTKEAVLDFVRQNGGFQKIAWTTGEQQADRYDLSKQVNAVEWNPKMGSVRVTLPNGNQQIIKESGVTSESLEDYVGKDAARKLGEQNLPDNKWRKLSGLDLKVGGGGMRSFYDVMLPQLVNKYVKKWGGKVGDTSVDIYPQKTFKEFSEQHMKAWPETTPEQLKDAFKTYGKRIGENVHSLTITPTMRDSVMRGQPMFSLADKIVGKSIRNHMDEVTDYLIYNYQDRFIDLRRIQKRGGQVPESQNASLSEELYSGRVAAQVQDFHDDMRDPLVKAIHDSGVKLEDVENYLHALHAPSRNAAMQEINPTANELENKKSDLSSERNRLAANPDVQEYLANRRNLRTVQSEIEDGVSDESDAEIIRGELSRLGNVPDVKSYLKTVDDMKALKNVQPFTGDNTALSGMSNKEADEIIANAKGSDKLQALEKISAIVDKITTKTRNIYEQSGLMTPESVSAMSAKYDHYVPLHRDEVGGDNPIVGQGYNIRGKEVKRATGSNKDVTNILAHLIAQHEAAIIRSEKSKVDRSLFDFATAHPDENLWTLDTSEKLRMLDPVTGTVVDRVNPTYKNKPNVLTLKIDGIEHTITFNESNPEAMRLATSMKNLSVAQLGEVTQMVGRFTRFLATMNTSANPVFVARNFLRDIQTAFINLTDTELAGIKKDVFRDIPKAIRGFWHMSRGNMDHEWAKDAREFRDAGGQVGWLEHYKNINDRAGKIKTQLEGMKPGKWNLTKQEASKWWSLIEDANNAVENGVRLAAYVNARKIGMTSAKSASLSKNLTVNFNRHGAKGVELNMWYMFANASIQGTARSVQALGNKNVRHILGYVIASGFLLDILARSMAGDDDDDGQNDYDQLPEYAKANNFVFWAGDRPITIPMPYGYNFIASIGRKMSESMFRKNFSPVSGAADLANVFVDAFNPSGQSGSLLQFISPTVVDPFVQWAENKNFAGYPLRKEQIPFGPPKPEYQMGLKSTSAPAKWLAEVLNNMSGGNEARPGAFNLNPGAIDFAVSSIAGGSGRSYLQAFSLPIKLSGEQEVQAREVPFANIFIGSKPEFQIQRNFYDNLQAVDLAHEEFKRYRGDPEMIRQLREQHGSELRMIERAKLSASVLKKLRERERLIEKSDHANKTEMLKQLETRKQEVMAQFNKRYNETRQ